MATETNRVQRRIQVTDPDDPSTFVGVNIIYKITFIDPKTYGQETQWTFDNTHDNTLRKTHVVKVMGTQDPSAYVEVERIDWFQVIDVKSYGQETKTFLGGNASEPNQPKSDWKVTTHDVKLYAQSNPDAWIVMRRIDKIQVIDPKSYGQEAQYALLWADDDATNPAELDMSSDGTTINPPWRFDPYQNLVDVNWSSEYLVLTHVSEMFGGLAGSCTLYDFNTPNLPSTWTLFEHGSDGAWASYPPQSDPITYSDTPNATMSKLVMWTSPDKQYGSLAIDPLSQEYLDESETSQTGYTVIRLKEAAATGATTLEFFIRFTSPGGGQVPSNGTSSYYTNLLSVFNGLYPLWPANYYHLFGVTGPIIEENPSSPFYGEPIMQWGVRVDTPGAYLNMGLSLNTVGSVSNLVHPDNSFGVGIYTSRPLDPNFTVPVPPDTSDPALFAGPYSPYWSGPGFGDPYYGTTAEDVSQSIQYELFNVAAVPPANAYDGTSGGPASETTTIYKVVVDLSTYAITVTLISSTP